MKFFFLLLLCSTQLNGLGQQTAFEKSGGKETATYKEIIDWYTMLDKRSAKLNMKTMGATDAGYSLHLVLISADGKINPAEWYKQGKVIIMINNGIHPGEPDGIDASMMLARDIINGKINLPKNVCLGIIPVYNIGGCLNRNSYTRANQNGPLAYGFRGNSQNLDLNRDFTKSDSKEAVSFAEIFHFLNPDIFLDNHVSDGADFQHTMTLISTQYDKLGKPLGDFLRQRFEPALYTSMKTKGWNMIPYVDFSTTDFSHGMNMFFESPRYSSGYAALFGTMSFISETHMLKPYESRVKSTYDLMCSFISTASGNAAVIRNMKTETNLNWGSSKFYPLSWKLDTSAFSKIFFQGYRTGTTESEATGLTRSFFNHEKPFEDSIRFFDHYLPSQTVAMPRGYFLKAGYGKIVELLKVNKIKSIPIEQDTFVRVTKYKITSYKSYPKAYEKHHKNYAVQVASSSIFIKFSKGDLYIPVDQSGARYIVEMAGTRGR